AVALARLTLGGLAHRDQRRESGGLFQEGKPFLVVLDAHESSHLSWGKKRLFWVFVAHMRSASRVVLPPFWGKWQSGDGPAAECKQLAQRRERLLTVIGPATATVQEQGQLGPTLAQPAARRQTRPTAIRAMALHSSHSSSSKSSARRSPRASAR